MGVTFDMPVKYWQWPSVFIETHIEDLHSTNNLPFLGPWHTFIWVALLGEQLTTILTKIGIKHPTYLKSTVNFRRVRILEKSACYLHHICLSVLVCQLGSRVRHFRKIWYWRLSWKSVATFENRLRFDKKYR